MSWNALLPEWRRDRLRTNLWLVPTLEMFVAIALFFGTAALDEKIYRGPTGLPAWLVNGGADTARQILISIAGAVITVVGIVFSITIVTLTLASTQFGPRLMRNFIRDCGTQLTLGTFVATFVYCLLVLMSVGPGDHGDYVPNISISVAFLLILIDVALLIYFIHHTATQIQLPQVIAGIAKDIARAIAQDQDDALAAGATRPADVRRLDELMATIEDSGAVIRMPKSGYVQFIHHDTLVRIAAEVDAVLRLPYRPGEFVVEGRELARVWPPEAAATVARHLRDAQVIGPYRTPTQDVAFGIDQLVEIAIHALSPAVNDTFTALTCVDWLGDCMCKLAGGLPPNHLHRDRAGTIRVICDQVSFERLVHGAFDKIRQAGRGMPEMMIRQLEALTAIVERTTDAERARALMDEAAMISRAGTETLVEESDRLEVQRRYTAFVDVYDHLSR